jgi:hypothetical protein
MPLIACPDCTREISDAAPSCIHCGRPMVPRTQESPVPPPPAEVLQGGETARGFGWAVSAVGVVWLIIALSMDTTVTTGAYDVHNVGLMNDKQIHVIAAIATVLAGLMLVGIGYAQRRPGSPPVKTASDDSKSRPVNQAHWQCPGPVNQAHWQCPLCYEVNGPTHRWCPRCGKQAPSDSATGERYLVECPGCGANETKVGADRFNASTYTVFRVRESFWTGRREATCTSCGAVMRLDPGALTPQRDPPPADSDTAAVPEGSAP